MLGRPGGVLADGEVVGSWRARRSGSGVAVTVTPWVPVTPSLRTAIGEQAERLAAFRRARLTSVTVDD
jgi:hypothetical protein